MTTPEFPLPERIVVPVSVNLAHSFEGTCSIDRLIEKLTQLREQGCSLVETDIRWNDHNDAFLVFEARGNCLEGDAAYQARCRALRQEWEAEYCEYLALKEKFEPKGTRDD